MTKLLKHTFLTAVFALLAGFMVFGQEQAISVPDTLLKPVSDTTMQLIPADSIQLDTLVVNDTIPEEVSKWNFLKGGNDSTYFSFYGHLLEVDDTNNVEFWQFTSQTHELELYRYDSTLTLFHISNPANRNSINNSFLGNMGSAVQSNLFFVPNPKTDFIFIQTFTPYVFQSSAATYYKVQMPFTKFGVNAGPGDEQDIDVLHTQNINKYFNAFIHFKSYTSEGQYINQENRNSTGIFGISYTQGRFATHANYVFSKISSEENGGIVDNAFILDTTLSSPSDINTRLTDGTNYMKDRQLFIDQKIGFFKTNVSDSAQRGAYWFSLQYNYQMHKTNRIYEDTDDSYTDYDLQSQNLYKHTYNGTTTFDSSFFQSKTQFLRINLEENPKSYPFVGAYFGIGQQANNYYFFNKDTLFSYTQSAQKSSQYLEGGLYRLKGKKFSFSANYTYFFHGYRQNDFALDGFISQRFGKQKKEVVLKAEAGQYRNTPDYLLQKYYSNHYRWNNNFDAEYRSDLKFSVELPGLHTKMGSRFALLKNYIYLDTDALPQQYDQAFTVLDVFADNQFNFWKFGTITRLNYQKTSNDRVLPLPEFSGYFALYFAPNVYFKDTHGHMKFQLGADVSYWTKYYGQAYSPALAMFHNQNYQQIGDYPFIGAFWNVEIKRMRFYIRYEHANYGLMGKNYFLAPNYPSNPSTLRYGLVWTFYN
jgi:hypothetical protein